MLSQSPLLLIPGCGLGRNAGQKQFCRRSVHLSYPVMEMRGLKSTE